MTSPEDAVLGSILLDNKAIHGVADILRPNDFGVASNAELFEAMLALNASGKPIDQITLRGVGQPDRLVDLLDTVPTAKNANHYARQVLDESQRRRLLLIADCILSDAKGGATTDDLVSAAERDILSLRTSQTKGGLVRAGDVAARLYDLCEQRAEGGGKSVIGRSTGLKSLDDLQAGLSPTDLIVLAGRPAMGKSALAQQILIKLLSDMKSVGVYFSLEMSADQLINRAQSQLSGIDSKHITTGRLKDEEWPALAKASAELSEMQFYLDDSGTQSMSMIASRCRALKAERGRLDIVVIDYLQLMSGDPRAGSREQAVSGMSREAKMLAKELAAPVILLSQLNRGLEMREDKRPRLSDLRESGAIEQDADEVLFIYRDAVYNENSDDDVAEIIVAKNRDGAIGRVLVSFDAPTTAFGD